MDDLYQFTADAVNQNKGGKDAEKQRQQQEQDDIVLKAFNSFGFSKKWDSLLDTVKKQGGAIVDVTRRDLQEFANVLKDDIVQAGDITNRETGEAKDAEREDKTNNESESSKSFDIFESSAAGFASLRESLGKLNTVNLDRMKEGLQHTLSNIPTSMESVHLPGNINIQQLRDELAAGSKFAEQYLEKFGTDAVQTLSRAITVVAPEDSEYADSEFGTSSATENQSSSKRIYWNIYSTSRKEAMVAELRTDKSYFMMPPTQEDEDVKKIYETFVAGFSVEEYTDEIAKLLQEYPDLRQTMDELVPVQVSYHDFWLRYFYRSWKIDQEDEKRRQIVQGADAQDDDDDADFKWDSDDDETPMQQEDQSTEVAANISTLPAHTAGVPSDTEFSNISASSTTEASLVSAPKEDEEDDDSDWE
ncbi:hypothetical protein INT43_002461 [Umbelopsis isabellina]|uniref:BSD domain-containing protein n=1 Tax=Mortierella isabellina TaxID=91625 RepID=A0A8H7UN99_MORIS|nr:hypothetical protein INT43_002461 [Umbelopsis isabellina]